MVINLEEMNIEERITTFKEDLNHISASIIVQKHITYGDCYVLEHLLYFELKSEIAYEFNLHPSQVLMVGSGKLGFSIVNNKRYRPFGDTSDIDIAIVCSELFDKIWEEAYKYQINTGYWSEAKSFYKYLFKGWIRPDILPPSTTFEIRQKWWDFFQRITNTTHYGIYKINAGLYKSWKYLESYQSQSVLECQKELEGDPCKQQPLTDEYAS